MQQRFLQCFTRAMSDTHGAHGRAHFEASQAARTQLPQLGVLQRGLRLLPPRGLPPRLPLLDLLCLLLGHYHHHPAHGSCMRTTCRWLGLAPRFTRASVFQLQGYRMPTAVDICCHSASCHHEGLFNTFSDCSWATVISSFRERAGCLPSKFGMPLCVSTWCSLSRDSLIVSERDIRGPPVGVERT